MTQRYIVELSAQAAKEWVIEMTSVRSENYRWQDTLNMLFCPVIIPVFLVMSALTMCVVVCWATISPVLPASWRFDPETAFALDPSVDADCPSCQLPMMLGQPATEPNRPFQFQTARCYRCRRVYHRHSLFTFWSAWKAET